MTLLLCAIQYTTLKSHAEDDIAGDAELCPKFNPHGSQTLIKIHLSSSSISNNCTYFANVTFTLVSLGDRSYGLDAFCAGGWKLATRLVQLVGYGDDSNNSGGGGGLADLDGWLAAKSFPVLQLRLQLTTMMTTTSRLQSESESSANSHQIVAVGDDDDNGRVMLKNDDDKDEMNYNVDNV